MFMAGGTSCALGSESTGLLQELIRFPPIFIRTTLVIIRNLLVMFREFTVMITQFLEFDRRLVVIQDPNRKTIFT